MIKYLIVLLSFVTVIGAAQITPAPIYRIPNTTTVFSTPLMAGAVLCDIGSGKTYRILRAVAGGQSLSTLTRLVDYRELTSSPVTDPVDNSLYTQLIYGTVTWSGTGLVYDISACQYYILGNIYNSAADDVTLDAADATLNRFDVIYADTLGNIGKITGDPAEDPFEPLVDPESQIRLTIIYVSAGATEPGTTVNVIYRENVEWTAAVVNQTNSTITFANTTTPFAGSKCVNVVASGNMRNSQFKFTGTSYIFADTDVFVFYLKSNASWQTASQIQFRWYNGTSVICSPVTIISGSYGYNSVNSNWQKIAIPMKDFKLTSISANILTVTFAGTWNAKTLKFDNLEIQPSSVVTSDLQGTGTKDYVVKWLDGKTLGKSVISESSGKIGVNILPATKLLDINGTAKLRDTLFLSTVPTNSTGGSKSYLTVDGEVVKKITRPDSDAVTYSVSAETGTGGAWLKILGSDGSKDSVKLTAGTNMTSIVRTDGNTITFNAAAGGAGATYTMSAETGSGGSWLKILGSDGSKDSVKLAAGTNMTSIVRTDANTITFNAAPATGATYGISAETGTGGAYVKILGSDLSKDSVKLAAGTNMTSIIRTSADIITFNAAAGGETYTMGTVAKATGAWIKILGSAGSKDSVFLKSGSGITVARYDNDTITIAAGAASVAGMVDDINFEFADILMGMAQTYTLDIKASYGYTINSATLELDNGTLTGIAIKINSTAVTSLSSVTATVTATETNATGANTVVAGDRIYIITSTGYTGVPTVLRGKLKITRT